MNFETIKFELKENGIGILSLNRPEKLNAINFQMEHSIDHTRYLMECQIKI